jgi:hypothetical protein
MKPHTWRSRPDFLPRSTGQSRMCAFLLRKAQEVANATKLDRKSGYALGCSCSKEPKASNFIEFYNRHVPG